MIGFKTDWLVDHKSEAETRLAKVFLAVQLQLIDWALNDG